MDRKSFLKQAICGGIGVCCGAALGRVLDARAGEAPSPAGAETPGWIHALEERTVKGAESPAWRRLDKAVEWITDMVKNADALLDEPTRTALMQACGRSCYNHAFGVASDVRPSREAAERYLKALEAGGYQVQRDPDKVIVHFNWGRTHQNPQGLIIQDGYCMCPIVEPIIPGMPATFCNCSAGYVREIFERSLGMPTEVTLLESLQTGGKDCRFRVVIPYAG